MTGRGLARRLPLVTGRGLTRRLLVVAVACSWLIVAFPGAASADPAGPTHYRSEVTGIRGNTAGIDADVFGGDSFLVLTVEPGREVVVPGYEEPELYLRFTPEGDVYVNTRSRTHYLNQDRYEDVVVPAAADPEAPPQWELVAEGGTYAWHDHRIHWMSPTTPRQVDTGLDQPQQVMPWGPIVVDVDGAPAAIEGELTWLPGPSPLLPVAVVVLTFAAVVAGALRRPVAVTGGALGVAGAAALAIGAGAWLRVPPGADPQPFVAVLPLVVLATVAAGALLARRRPARGRLLLALGGVPLLAWSVIQVGALTRPLLPIGVPESLVRVVVAVGLGVGAATVAAAAVAAWRAPVVTEPV